MISNILTLSPPKMAQVILLKYCLPYNSYDVSMENFVIKSTNMVILLYFSLLLSHHLSV